MHILELAGKEFLVFQSSQRLSEIDVNNIFKKRIRFILVLKENNIERVLNINTFFQYWIEPEHTDLLLKDINDGEIFQAIEGSTALSEIKNISANLAVVVDKKGFPQGVIPNLKAIVKAMREIQKDSMMFRDKLHEYQQIVEFLEEEIFVTDGKGNITFLNPQAEKVCGVKVQNVLGRHVSELEKEKVFSSSTTLEVLRTGKKVNLLQKLKNGKTVLATGIPIFRNSGELTRILSTSKDVKEINNLITKLEHKDLELERKNQELNTLREEVFAQEKFICSSKEMDLVKDTILKIAPTDLTVMIQGESGVGKEVVTKVIHRLSARKKQPLIKINCGLIPENLMESELFGYEGGAFTGANKRGKLGKIELANRGTLFLDEIGEMPLSLQVKLLEFLQDREITRVGGTSKIKIDTRVIVATNRDLQQMVIEKRFRQDLFYRLNIIPINIPPLRERIEDIPSLINYFLKKFNGKYNLNKRFADEVIVSLYCYNWPGNVRELEHVVERLVVTSDSDVVTKDDLSDIISTGSPSRGKVICTDLVPLKEAKKELEEQLVKRAYNIYRSTYKMGEVLQVHQMQLQW